MQLILFIGIPGSGKSTFYKEHFFHTHMRVNLDMLRTRNREHRLLSFCFQTSMPLVIDNTNVTILDRKKYIDLAIQHRYSVVGYYFEADLQSCLKRNATRSGRQQISEKGVIAKYRALQKPSIGEGFQELYYVQLTLDNEFTIKSWQHEIQ